MISKADFFNTKLKLLFIYFIPVILLLWFVASFSVNVPLADQWELVNLFDKVSIGKARFGDFFAQHNEHRILFPRIVIVLLAFISKWNIRYELYFSILLTILTFFTLYKLSFIQEDNKYKTSVHLTNILTCILLFSLVQQENWLWGFQLAWFLINTCLAIAVLLIALSNNSPKRLYFAAIPCFIASFSSAHGLLTWLAVIPSVASVNGSSRQRRIRVIIWILLFAATCAVYSIGYHKPSQHPSILFFLKKPLVAGNYFFTLLATPLVSRYTLISPLTGLILCLIFLFLTIQFIRKSKYRLQLDSQAAAWISISLFTILFAVITTLGRAGFGVEQAMSSRYTTSSVLLIISIAHLWRLFYSNNSFIAGLITGLIIINSVDVIPQAASLQLQRQASATCLELVNFIDKSSDNCLKDLYPSTTVVRKRAGILEKLGFREFPKDIAFVTKPAKVHGFIDSPPTGETTTLNQNGSLNAAGWAILPNSRELPKTVLFSYGSNRSFFTTTVVNLDSLDVAKALNSEKYNKVRWSVNISPMGETVIKAWVYDPAGKQFIQLNGEPKIKVVE